MTMNLLHFPHFFIASLLIDFWVPKAIIHRESSKISSTTCCFTQCKGCTHARRNSFLSCNNNLACVLCPSTPAGMLLLGTAVPTLYPAACWPTGLCRDRWEKFWRVLKARLLELCFTTAAFNSKSKSVITTGSSGYGHKLKPEVQGATNTLIYCNRHQSSFIKTWICAVQWFDKKPR